MRAPMMSIHTVAAGGGSILAFDGARLRVGPESAGANPGPACYRRGGPLAITDANVMLGKIQPAHFPQRVRPGGRRAARPRRRGARSSRRWPREVRRATGRDVTRRGRWPRASCSIAVANMANAIKRISVARGYDVTRYTLQCFGGAGGQHACLVADALGMTRVFIHPLAGVLSAYGMGLADQIAMREAAVELPLDAAGLRGGRRSAWPSTRRTRPPTSWRARASRATRCELAAPRAPALRGHRHRAGRGAARDAAAAIQRDFEAAYRQRFAFLMPDRALVIEAVSVEAVARRRALRRRGAAAAPSPAPHARGAARDAGVRMYCERWRDAGLYVRESLRAGATDRRPGDHRRAQCHHRGRARLAGAR